MPQLDDLIRSQVQCPQCKLAWAWLGDQGQSVMLHGRCLACLLLQNRESHLTEEELDVMVERVAASRERYERESGRRVLPCPHCMLGGGVSDDCPRCHGHGWVLGYPPKQPVPG